MAYDLIILFDTTILHLFVVAAIVIIIGLNVLGVYYIIKRALNKYVKPKLQSSGLIFTRYKWVGFFGVGDFKNEKLVLRPINMGRSNAFLSIYIYVYYEDLGAPKRITIRIDTLFLFIRNVIYSSEF